MKFLFLILFALAVRTSGQTCDCCPAVQLNWDTPANSPTGFAIRTSRDLSNWFTWNYDWGWKSNALLQSGRTAFYQVVTFSAAGLTPVHCWVILPPPVATLTDPKVNVVDKRKLVTVPKSGALKFPLAP